MGRRTKFANTKMWNSESEIEGVLAAFTTMSHASNISFCPCTFFIIYLRLHEARSRPDSTKAVQVNLIAVQVATFETSYLATRAPHSGKLDEFYTDEAMTKVTRLHCSDPPQNMEKGRLSDARGWQQPAPASSSCASFRLYFFFGEISPKLDSSSIKHRRRGENPW